MRIAAPNENSQLTFLSSRAQYSARSVLAGLIFSLGGSILLFVAFCLIRPRNNVVYAPRIKYNDSKRPQTLGNHPLSWIKQVYLAKEHQLVDHIGIDATLYIRFMAMCRNIFLILAFLGSGIMIPINVVYNLKNPSSEDASKSDAFFLTTPTLIYGHTLYAHVVITWVFDLVILTFLWMNFNKVIQMRRQKFMSEEYQNALFMRSLMITEIPKKYMSDNGLIALMGKLKVSRPIQNASVGRNVKRLGKLIKKHEETVLALESVLAKYLKDPENLPAQRPRRKAFKEDRGKNGTYTSEKVDAIDYLCWRMDNLENQIEQARDSIDTQKSLPYGFVSYESVEDCHTVAKSTKQKRKGKLNSVLAPQPQDIIWDNIVLTRFERSSKQKWGNFLFICLVIGWIIPNAFMGAFLSNLSRIGALWSAFNTFIIDYPVLFSILQGVLSPVVTSLVFLILPSLMRRMAQAQGKVTKHEREIAVTRKLYAFFVFNNLFVFTIFGVAWSVVGTIITLVRSNEGLSFKEVIDQLDVADQLSTAILSASSFWVMYILRVNLGAVLDLLQLVSLIWRGFQRHFMSPTPRELMMWTAPQHFNYAAYYNWLLFYTTIALCFSVVQPLVLPVIALYFTMDSIYKKYSLMYIFETKAESDGKYWPFLFNGFLFATGFGNVVIFAVLWVQGGWRVAICLAPLLPLLIIFKITSARVHNDRFNYFIPTADEQERMAEIRTRTNLSDISHHALAKRYRNPAITTKLIVPMVHAKAQHVLAQVCNISNFDHEALDMETAFIGMDESFEHNFDNNEHEHYDEVKLGPQRSNATAIRNGGLKFDIINESDINYECYQEIERARFASTPFKPDSEPSLFESPSMPAPSLPALPTEYKNGDSSSSHLLPLADEANSIHHMTSSDSLIHHPQPPPITTSRHDYGDLNSVHSLPHSYYNGGSPADIPTHSDSRRAFSSSSTYGAESLTVPSSAFNTDGQTPQRTLREQTSVNSLASHLYDPQLRYNPYSSGR